MEKQKEYLGDGVYVEEGSYLGEIVLYCDNGIKRSNHIYLEPDMVERLKKIVDQFIVKRVNNESL